MMQESDTYLMILEEGEEKRAKKDILLVGELRLGPPSDAIKQQLNPVSDLQRLDRMMRKAVAAVSWQEIVDAP